MAIEFNCPYCTSAIRVPDPYAGKQGRCPKCDTRLVVPMVNRPGSTAPVSSPIEPTRLPATEPGPLPVADHREDGVLPTEEFIITTPSPIPALSRKRRGRRRTSRTLLIGVPVIGFLVLLGAIFYGVLSGLPDLKGQLPARRFAESSLPRTTIPWSETGLSDEDRKTLKDFLQMTPEVLSSQILSCRLIGADAGIEVQLTSAPDSQWIAVEASKDKSLALWLKHERSSLNARRVSALQKTLASYCRDKLAQINGESVVIDAVTVRDGIGFNAGGGPLSSVVDAVAGDLLVPCADEDDEGTLYFCLPKNTSRFRILGRTFPGGVKPFRGEYTVVVPEETVTAESSDPALSESSATEPESEEKNITPEPDQHPIPKNVTPTPSMGNPTDMPRSD